MKIYRIAQFDQEPQEPAMKELVKRISLYDPSDLEYIEGLHLILGEEILPYQLIDMADEVEIWKTRQAGHPQASQHMLSFLHNGKVIKDVTVNTLGR